MDDYGDEDKDPSAHQPIRKPSMRFRQSKNERKSKEVMEADFMGDWFRAASRSH